MDEHLKRLAEASLAVAEAEAAVGDGAHQTALDALERVDAELDALRSAWPGMSSPERRLVGQAAREVRGRRDAAAARVPRRRALAVTPGGQADPEQEQDPEEAVPAA